MGLAEAGCEMRSRSPGISETGVWLLRTDCRSSIAEIMEFDRILSSQRLSFRHDNGRYGHNARSPWHNRYSKMPVFAQAERESGRNSIPSSRILWVVDVNVL